MNTARSDNLLPVEDASAIDINARVKRGIPVEPDDGEARHRDGSADKPTDIQGQQSTLRVHLHYTASHDINVGSKEPGDGGVRHQHSSILFKKWNYPFGTYISVSIN